MLLKIAEHCKALEAELAKDKPRDTVILPIMSTLFTSRRSYIEHDAEDVKHILLVYPALKRPTVVSFIPTVTSASQSNMFIYLDGARNAFNFEKRR